MNIRIFFTGYSNSKRKAVSEPSVLDLFLTYQHSRNVLPIIGRQLNGSHMDDRSAPWTAQAAPEPLWFNASAAKKMCRQGLLVMEPQFTGA